MPCCRVFALIENSVHQHTRGSDAAAVNNLNSEEAMLDVCLLSTTNSIMQQCSLPIYTVSVSSLYDLFVIYVVNGGQLVTQRRSVAKNFGCFRQNLLWVFCLSIR